MEIIDPFKIMTQNTKVRLSLYCNLCLTIVCAIRVFIYNAVAFYLFLTGRYAVDFLSVSKVKYWPTPADSPNLNPIEMVWHELKEAKDKEELVKGIKDFWATVTAEKCKKYINHLSKVVPIIVERNGRASGH